MREKRIKGEQEGLKVNTIVIGIRIKPITLANVGKFLHDNGESITTIGGIARRALEIIESHTLVDGKFTTNHQAVNWMKSKGIINDNNVSTTNKRRLSQCVNLELLQKEKDLENDIREAKRRFSMLKDDEVIRFSEDLDANAGKIAPMIPENLNDLVVDSDD